VTDQPSSPTPPLRTLSPEHCDHLAGSGLTAITLASAGLFTVTGRAEICQILRREYAIPPGPCIAFPFWEPGAAQPYAWRLRPDHPRLDTRKDPPRAVKYDQATDVGMLVYYPPSSRVRGYSQDPHATVHWVEGEKKALALDQEGYLVIGLTGVWNWGDPEIRKQTSAYALHPRILRHVPIEGRAHVIVFDRDARANTKVMSAARKLAGVLLALGALSVSFVAPPDWGEPKGIDDYLAARGAAELHTLLSVEAYPLDPRDPSERGASPLGSHPYLVGASGLDGLALPAGYELSETGALMQHGAKRTLEALARVMFIRGRFEDIATGEHWAEVTYRNLRGWVSHTLPRRVLVDQRSVVASLGALGAPLTSQSARAAVEWFGAFELANETVLTPRRMASRCGWHGSIFVSHRGIGATDLTVGGDLGDVVRALTPRGSFDDHIAALREAWCASPVLRLLICAALAVPMLDRLGAPNFAVHLCGDSSKGKTTMLRVVASIYGDPWAGAWVASWNTTANATEVRAQLLCDLPLFYDELGVSTLDTVQRLIYSLVNGEGKIRLNRDASARRVHRWRTGVLSTGEVPLGDETAATGAQARVVNVEVDGWGALDNQRPQIEQLVQRCAANAGSFGEMWLTQLVALSADEWASLRGSLASLSFDSTQLTGRLAAQSALFRLIARLLVGNWQFPNLPIDEASEGGDDEDSLTRSEVVKSTDYMQQVLADWLRANPTAFPRADLMPGRGFRVRAGSHSPVRYGVLVCDDSDRVVETLILRTELARLFKFHNRVLTSVLRAWARAGLIEVERYGGKTRYTARRSEHGMGQGQYVVWVGPMSDGGDE
jgi:hypothetical protein